MQRARSGVGAEAVGTGEAGFAVHRLLFRRDGRFITAQGAQQAGVVG